MRITANYAQKLLWSDKMYISFEQNNAALDKNLFRLLQFIKNTAANLRSHQYSNKLIIANGLDAITQCFSNYEDVYTNYSLNGNEV